MANHTAKDMTVIKDTDLNTLLEERVFTAVECGPIVPPASGTFEPARCTQVNSNVFRDKCHLKCHEGYAISDVSQGTLTCGSRGRWEGTVGTCQPVSCPKLPAFSNGGLLPSSCTSSGGKYPNKCSYYCSSGYSLQGGQFRQCQADGTWDGTAPTCTKILAKPWIRCPDHIILDLLPGKSSADVSSVWKEPTSNVEPAQITISPPEISSSYQFPPGTTKVTWTASNVEGSQRCSSYVIIYDKEAPTVANCPQEILEISSGPKAVTWVEPTFRDNVKVTKIDTSHTSGSIFEMGSTYVSYTAEDAARNTAFCKFKVQLKRLECYEPNGPDGGTKQCNEFGGSKFCTVTCNSGSQLYREAASYWQCKKGVWTPNDVIPDCVEASLKDPNTSCQENQFVMNITNVFGTNLYCAKCPTGAYKSSITDCNPCPAGSYNDQQGQLQCTLCPTGTSSLPGAKSALDCKAPCTAGQFSKTGLGPNCQYCPRDSYQDKVQQKSCTPCPNDTHTLSLGAKSLAECGARPKVNRMVPVVANIKEGESVSVVCYASGTPTPSYFWKFLKNIPGNFLGSMSQTSIKDGIGVVIGSKLTITGATYENSGLYECRVSNTHGEHTALAQVNVAKVIDIGSGLDEPL
ncbi:sushi, von Willebrand factor type A, EGF and pentraxin domain-containing protein 1-like [Porites lutea]|uniref:sushi, von Willebrand factor type A, EGF and pentraxin domain-containing protein 1-like n=1 Tax=Porites lutea TaxID=51062 RepID=UPI003CC5CF53